MELATQQKVEAEIITSTPAWQRFWLLLSLLFVALLLELLYLLLLAITPLSELHLNKSPLAIAWPWTLALSHMLFPLAWNSSNIFSSRDWPYILLLGLTLTFLASIYMFAISNTFRIKSSIHITSRWLLLPLLGAIIFGFTLLLQPALFSNDVFTYIFSGRLLSIYHADPMSTAPIQFVHDPYIPWISHPATPNIYGPLWLSISSLLVEIGRGPVGTLLLFKGVALFSHLFNCLLVWAILSQLAPARRLAGTLVYAWNPLALIELAGSGHNEGLLLSLFLLATWLYVQGKGRFYEIGILVLFGLALSINLIALLIAPLYIWLIIRNEGNIRRAVWGFCWRMLVVLAIMIALYLPFWKGASTFLAITSTIDIQHFFNSPLALLVDPLRWIFTLIARWSHFPPIMQPNSAADMALRASATFIFALIYLHLFALVRRIPSTIEGIHHNPDTEQEINFPDFDILLNCCCIAVLGYLVFVSGWFWPWYVLWVLWIAALRRFDALTLTMLLLSSTMLLTYPWLDLHISPTSPLGALQPLLIFGIPFVYLIGSRKRRRERKAPLYDR